MGGLGSGGHNKKPAKFHKLAGSYRKDRHGHEVPMGIESEKVQKNPPKWLSKHGKAFWREHRDYCIHLGTLDALTSMYFEIVCEGYAHVRELDEAIQQDGEVIQTSKGPKPHPLLSARNSANRELLRGMAEYGLTLAGRKRLKIEWPAGDEEAEANPFEEFMNRTEERAVRLVNGPQYDPRKALNDDAS